MAQPPKPTRETATVIQLPDRHYVVEVTYRIKIRHSVQACTVSEAEEKAPDCAIAGDVEVLDIIDAEVIRQGP